MLTLNPIPRVDKLDKKAFQQRFFVPKLPVVIKSLTHNWPAYEKWNLDYFRQVAGDNIIPLYNSQPARGKQHQHAAAAHLPFSQFLDLLEQGEKDLRMFFWQIMKEAPVLTADFQYPDLGMSFFKRLPVLFFAGKDARVNLHFDIDLADILLCHFGGPKTIYLFPPSQTENLYRVPFSFSSIFDIDISQPDYQRFPKLRQAQGYQVTLEHGQVLYIPSGYWHYVVYNEISCSMSLRALPTKLTERIKVFHNIAILRTVDGLMRKLLGDRWVERNLKRASR